MCGDSTDPATVEKLMGGVKAELVLTDPPYKINNSKFSGVFQESMKNVKDHSKEHHIVLNPKTF
jgi:DNA modification methylase